MLLIVAKARKLLSKAGWEIIQPYYKPVTTIVQQLVSPIVV
jgi:hypothetical protein